MPAGNWNIQPAVLLQTACELMDINALTNESSKVVLVNMYQATCEQMSGIDLNFEILPIARQSSCSHYVANSNSEVQR